MGEIGKNLDEALYAAKKAVELSKEDPQILDTLAEIYYKWEIQNLRLQQLIKQSQRSLLMNTIKGKKKSSLQQSPKRENEVKIFRDVEASVLHILSSNKFHWDTFDRKFLSLKKKFGNEIYPTFYT